MTYAGPDGISVAFAAGFNGGAPIRRTPQRAPRSDASPSGSVTATSSPIVVSGLAIGHPYQCTVTAANLVGSSAPSSPSGVIWPGSSGVGCGMPSAPSRLSTAPGNASAVVSWAPAASGCVAGYIVTPFLGSVAQLATLIPGQGTTTVISGLVERLDLSVHGHGRERHRRRARVGAVAAGHGRVAVGGGRGARGAGRVRHAPRRVQGAARNGASIPRFTVSCSSAIGGTTRAAAGKIGPLTVSWLTVGKTYVCTVVAVNSRGTGPSSARSAAVRA